MEKKFTVLIEKGEDGFLLAQVLELPGCRTQAKTHDELLVRVREAIELFLDQKDNLPKTSFVDVVQIEVSHGS